MQDIGANVATPRERSNERKLGMYDDLCSLKGIILTLCLGKTIFESHHAEQLEKWIDAMTLELPKLTKFILPVRMKRPWARVYQVPYDDSFFLVWRKSKC